MGMVNVGITGKALTTQPKMMPEDVRVPSFQVAPSLEDDEVVVFKHIPDELICPIHLGHMTKPVVSKCGHSFCRVKDV